MTNCLSLSNLDSMEGIKCKDFFGDMWRTKESIFKAKFISIPFFGPQQLQFSRELHSM